MWLCCGEQIGKKIFPFDIYNQFSREHPEDPSQLQTVNVKESSKMNIQQYEDWSRIKFKSRNQKEILEYLKEEKKNFIDEDFPHCDESISRDEQISQKIEWKRLGKIIEEPVFSNLTDVSSVEKYKLNNKALQNALTLISRTHPKKFKNLLNQEINPQGIYSFMFFVNGVIQNVIIDDYVPTYKGYSLFSGPVHDKEVYPMLLEKAIAKVYGSYSNMPKKVQKILEMLYCGAICKKNLQNLQNKEEFEDIVAQTFKKKGMNLLYSKQQSKIRQYGINENQIYQILSQNFLSLNNSNMVFLYELVSENKLSAWNGKYSLTDGSWKAVKPEDKEKLFKRMKENNSFFVQDSDISRNFGQLIVYNDTQTKNKDWLEDFSQRQEPSFARFTLKQTDQVFIRVLAKYPIRQSLVISSIQNNEYNYITGQFSHQSKILQTRVTLGKGDYLLCLTQDWVGKKEGEYAVYLSSASRINLQSEIEHNHFKFLEKMILNYLEKKNKEERKSKNSPIIKEIGVLKDIGLGFMNILVQSNYDKLINLTINKKQLDSLNWELMEPYKGMQNIIVTQNTLVKVKLTKKIRDEEVEFPNSAFKFSG